MASINGIDYIIFRKYEIFMHEKLFSMPFRIFDISLKSLRSICIRLLMLLPSVPKTVTY